MSTVSQIINLAEHEIGTVEKSENNIKYTKEFYGHEVTGLKYAWCAVFIWWLFKKTNSLAAINNCKTDSVNQLFDEGFSKSEQYTENPLKYAEPGDIAFFHTPKEDRYHHVGLIIQNNHDGSVITIEGNTSGSSSGSQANGDGVWRKTRYDKEHRKDPYYITAIAKPNYDAVTDPAIPPVGDTSFDLPSGHYYGNRPSSSNCHSGRIAADKEAVKMIQRMVGVSADGIFGSGTEEAVKRWQSAHGLTADGMVGKNTWNAMFNGSGSGSTSTTFPLPSGHYFGNRPSSSNCHSGRIAGDKQYVRMIQNKVGVSADGIFGSGTESAVKTWQSNHGLTADGMVGQGTWKAMFG